MNLIALASLHFNKTPTGTSGTVGLTQLAHTNCCTASKKFEEFFIFEIRAFRDSLTVNPVR